MECKNCNNSFTITEQDRQFYNKMRVPDPTWCPDCRQQRRLSFRNVGHLYLRKCDLTGKDIISNYSPDKPFKIFEPKAWWGDQWDPMEYGQDYDFGRSFFDQYRDLQQKVPRPALLDKNSTNSDYTNHGGYNKNCYMCFNVGHSEEMYYCTNFILYSKDCVDSYDMQKCELLYECFACIECYSSKYLLYCQKCSDSAFLYDCHGCSDCFMCWNLRNQEYCIKNKKYSPQEYAAELAKIYPQSYGDWQKQRQEFLDAVSHQAVGKYARVERSNDCTGNQLANCQRVRNTHYAFESVDSVYCYDIGEYKDSYDTYESWKGELNYEAHAIHQSFNLIGCSICYDDNDIYYCEFCYNSKNLFGCIGLNKKEYCILNKQYTEEEYKKLGPRIVEEMRKAGEWGEFFPMSLSPFCYNESVAQEYYPLTREEVLARGLKWKDEAEAKVDNNFPICLSCHKNFKLIPQEIKFYDKMQLPKPEKCYKCRYADRIKLRDARQLWQRECFNCKKVMESIYSPDRPEKVYCEECYQKEIY